MQLFPAGRAGLTPALLAAVAAGGALGSVGRWGVAELWSEPTASPSWQWPILIVNVVGSFAIGIVGRRQVPGSLAWSFTVTGVLGGFTTFSAFAVALDDLADAGRLELAVSYGATTLVAGLAATWLAGALPTPPREAGS